MRSKKRFLVVCLLATVAASGVQAQGELVGGIYTCVDSQGHKLTSDRPIAQCTDRSQTVLNPSGTVRATVGPSLSAKEQEALDKQARREAEERIRLEDEKRRDKALVMRYPNSAAHEKERKEAIDGINTVLVAANQRVSELTKQRGKIDDEMEFYKKDPTRAPAYLRRALEENTQSMAVQQRFIAEQKKEIQRVNMRFDEELVRLKVLWVKAAPVAQ